MPEIKFYDERHRISRKGGNGFLRREVWGDHRGVVTRYNLPYIKHLQFVGDNGRVLGYDNRQANIRKVLGDYERGDLKTLFDCYALTGGFPK